MIEYSNKRNLEEIEGITCKIDHVVSMSRRNREWTMYEIPESELTKSLRKFLACATILLTFGHKCIHDALNCRSVSNVFLCLKHRIVIYRSHDIFNVYYIARVFPMRMFQQNRSANLDDATRINGHNQRNAVMLGVFAGLLHLKRRLKAPLHGAERRAELKKARRLLASARHDEVLSFVRVWL